MMNLGTLKRINAKLTAIVALCLLSNAFGQSASPQHARLSLISDRSAITPGQSEWIGLRFELDPGWHIYWINPGDSGEPPKITWRLPAGMQAGDLDFPTPQRIPDHSLMDYGYQGNVVLLSKLTTANALTSKQADISADVKYLVCREVCVPGKDHLSLALPVADGGGRAPGASEVEAAERHLPLPLPHSVRISAISSQDAFVLTVASGKGSLGQITDFIPADAQVIENTVHPTIKSDTGRVVIRLKKSEQLDHPVSQLRGLLVTGDRAYNVVVPVTLAKTQSRSYQIRSQAKE
jgi:thiol:disulfide interchange protein DsbD